MIRPLALLLLGFLVLWAVVGGFVYFGWEALGLTASISREHALLIHNVATGLCVAPMAVTLIWTQRAKRSAPDQQMLAFLGGTGLRMFFVLGVGLLLSPVIEPLGQNEMLFWLWVLVVYLVTLTLEVFLLVSARDAWQGKQAFDSFFEQ